MIKMTVLVFEYASNETEDIAPLTHLITTRLGKKLGDARKNGDLRGVDSFIDAEAQVATHSFKRKTDLGFYTRPVLETSGDDCVSLKDVTDLFEADQGISVVHQRQTHTLQADNQEAVARQQQKHSNEQQPTRQVTQEKRGEREGEEREKGRKGERGKKKKGREAEEERYEEVKKDMTGWTVVTRNRREKRRTIQIFVKVNESRTFPLDVSPDDKVHDVIRHIQRGGRVCDIAWESAQEK